MSQHCCFETSAEFIELKQYQTFSGKIPKKWNINLRFAEVNYALITSFKTNLIFNFQIVAGQK